MGEMKFIKVLVIDDDPDFIDAVDAVLSEEGYDVIASYSGAEGIKELEKSKDIRIVLLDLVMEGISGEDVLRKLREDPDYREMPIVIITGEGDFQRGQEMIKAGADKFIAKPLTADELVNAVKGIITSPNNCMKVGWTHTIYDPDKGNALQSKNEAMLSILDRMGELAPSAVPVLISGEIGTGKKLLARTIHDLSNRNGKPFIQIDCLNLSDYEFAYSLLWGHEDEAIPGLLKRRDGRIRHATGGTVFLYRVDALENRTQTELAEFIKTGKFRPKGGNEFFESDCRIITATHINIKEAIENGQIRSELHELFQGNEIYIHPLRERQKIDEKKRIGISHYPISNDIEVLTDYFIDRYNKTEKGGYPVRFIENVALDILKKHYWPGNVRQLSNVINEAAYHASRRRPDSIITKNDIEENDYFKFPPNPEPSPSITLKELYDRMDAGDDEDAIRFDNKVNVIMNSVGQDLSKAAKLAKITEAEMQKYINSAKDIEI